jgi:hypothetical protein
MATSELHIIYQRAQQLPSGEQLELIKRLAETLAHAAQVSASAPRYLVYGEFARAPGRRAATEEDFALAEWHPTEAELNGV